MRCVDKLFLRRWGYTVLGIRCKLKFIVNRLVRLPLKYVSRRLYERFSWFRTPFSLRDCVFRSSDGLLFRAHDGSVLWALYLPWKTEPHNFKVLRDVLRRDSTFIDVGAHLGGYTLRAARICPDGIVVALEPDPAAYHSLVENVALNNFRNVVTLPLAAFSESFRLLEFNVYKVSSLSSLTDLNKDTYVRKINVLTITLDDLKRLLDLKHVDLVKIDVEGAEAHVLRGARTLMREGTMFLIEAH